MYKIEAKLYEIKKEYFYIPKTKLKSLNIVYVYLTKITSTLTVTVALKRQINIKKITAL